MLGICLALIDEPSDKEKFEHLYYTYNDMMLKIAMSVLHNNALANETVQDCLLKLAEIITEVPDVPSKNAKAIIISMVKNKARNNLKAEHFDREELSEESEISDNVINEIQSKLGFEELIEMVDSLEAAYRDVLVLRFLEEFNIGEIAEMLELPYRTVETRIFRGRKLLKEKLEGVYNERSN